MGDHSEDEPDDFYISPALPVSQFIDYDFSKPPATGQDYLRRVQLEAKQYPDVVTADIDPSRLSKISNSKLARKLIDNFIKADEDICPSQEWQEQIVKRFSKIREKVADARASIENEPLSTPKPALPNSKNLVVWKKIILGNVDQDEENEDEKNIPGMNGERRIVCSATGGQLPRLSFILAISQNMIIDLLEWQTKWIKEDGFSHQMARWIYSLLACLEKPLHSENIDILRKLSRTCSFIRSKHKLIEDKTLVTSLNMIICLIGRSFNQLDLTDQSDPTPLTADPT